MSAPLVTILDDEPAIRSMLSAALEEAALVAGYHSKARNELEADVSYLPMNQLSRPKNSRPGQVLKKSESVVSIRPDRFRVVREHLLRWQKEN